MVNWVLLLHAGATALMAGLIWFVQVVHYPLMAMVGGDDAARRRYALEHQRRTTWIVAPVMLVESVAAAVLLVLAPGWLTAAGAVLLAVIWASTFWVQVPLHGRLAAAVSNEAQGPMIARLVMTNWVRTAAWTLRLVLSLVLLGPWSEANI
jgi:uncharacterized membrane protein